MAKLLVQLKSVMYRCYQKLKHSINNKIACIRKYYKFLCEKDLSPIEKFQIILNLLDSKIKRFIYNISVSIENRISSLKKEYETFLEYHPVGYKEQELEALCNIPEKDRTPKQQGICKRYLLKKALLIPLRFIWKSFKFLMFSSSLFVFLKVFFVLAPERFVKIKHCQQLLSVFFGFVVFGILLCDSLENIFNSIWSNIRYYHIDKYVCFVMYLIRKVFKNIYHYTHQRIFGRIRNFFKK